MTMLQTWKFRWLATKPDLPLEFPVGWLLAIALYGVQSLWTAQTKITFPDLRIDRIGYLCLFIAAKTLFFIITSSKTARIPAKFCPSARKFFLGCEFIILCHSLGVTLWAMSYLRCTWDFPLIDPQLFHIDQMMGFDWVRLFQGSTHGIIGFILKNAYESIRFQLFFFSVWCAWFSRKDRMVETLAVLFSSLIVTIFIAGFLPALGPATALDLNGSFNFVHNQGVADFLAIRSPNVAHVAISNIGGIVAFPSFHTVAALVYIYAFRQCGAVSLAALLLNSLMILATPAYGDHYIIDVIAAVPVAALCIFGVRGLLRRNKAAFLTAET